MPKITIGDRNRVGDLKITDTNFSGPGRLRVTVVDEKGTNNSIYSAKQEIARARALARRADPERDLGTLHSAALVNTFTSYGCTHYTFELSYLMIPKAVSA